MREALLLGLLCLSCCSGAAFRFPGPVPTQQPMALVDAYLIAHGMATSYAESETADPAVVDQLVTLDRRAAEALRSLSQVSDSDAAATAAAIAALTGFAARQSTAAQ